MFASRRRSEAIETRSVFSSTIHLAYVVHIQEISYISHVRGDFSPVVCRQLSLSPTLSLFTFHFSLLLVWQCFSFSSHCW